MVIDAETKPIPAFRTGKRDVENTRLFIQDLVSRLTNRVQISSDAFALYAREIERSVSVSLSSCEDDRSRRAACQAEILFRTHPAAPDVGAQRSAERATSATSVVRVGEALSNAST